MRTQFTGINLLSNLCTHRNSLQGSPEVLTYSAQVSATRASSDYTARIIPYHANVSVPLETGQILWQR